MFCTVQTMYRSLCARLGMACGLLHTNSCTLFALYFVLHNVQNTCSMIELQVARPSHADAT